MCGGSGVWLCRENGCHLPTDGFTATDMVLFEKADGGVVLVVANRASLEIVGRYVEGLE